MHLPDLAIRMDVRNLSLLLLGFLAVSSFYGETAVGVRVCGRRLADLLNFICEKHGGFHAPRLRRNVPIKTNGKGPFDVKNHPPSRRSFSSKENENMESEATASFQRGVVDECCRKQCTLATLVSYCAHSQNAGNIDLEEILPPEFENAPAISAEDIAEYQMQQEMSNGAPAPTDVLMQLPLSPTGGLAHSSRPNLGMFSRNRPVFVVVSQLQDDEDRALGDYRF